MAGFLTKLGMEESLKSRGHTQILVYSDPTSVELDKRYKKLGMRRGGDYACYWADIEPRK